MEGENLWNANNYPVVIGLHYLVECFRAHDGGGEAILAKAGLLPKLYFVLSLLVIMN